MSMRIGASCVIDSGDSTDDCAVDEIRFLKDPSRFSNAFLRAKHDIEIGKYLIANICLKDGLSEKEIREFAVHVASNLVLHAFAKPYNTRLTVCNEPMKFLTKEEYAWYINVVYDELKFKKGYKFDIGAGNEEFALAYQMENMYEYLLQMRSQGLCNFDILDVHIQSSCNTIDKLNYWGSWIKAIKAKYSIKRISCTEANWMDVSTEEGYIHLLRQLQLAEDIGCEDFCIVFIKLNNMEKYRWLSFVYNEKVRSPYWEDLKRIIKEKKAEPIMEVDMKLENLKVGSRGNQVLWLQEILEIEYGIENKGEFDGVFGKLTDEQVRKYQEANNLVVDGIVGKKTTWKLIEEAENPNYWYQKLVIYMSYE